ncbi:hypothetical protein [Pelobium manganitolerans]|nr:hypothetical protein [Pelobium manganitolerans]
MKALFKLLNRLNKMVLPSLYRKDPNRLTKFEKVLTAYRYWVLTNSL